MELHRFVFTCTAAVVHAMPQRSIHGLNTKLLTEYCTTKKLNVSNMYTYLLPIFFRCILYIRIVKMIVENIE